MSWDVIANAASWYHEHRLSSCCQWLVPNAETLDRLYDQVALLDRRRIEEISDPGLRLAWLLRTFRPRNSSNPKDKVYALMPMLPGIHAEEYIAPDYSDETTAEEVFVQTVLKIIKTTKSLDVLHRSPRDDEGYFKLLPSWTPDFSTSPIIYGMSSHFDEQMRLYDACGGQEAELYDIESNILVVKGCLLDEIAHTSSFTFEWASQSSRVHSIKEWLEFAQEHSVIENDEREAVEEDISSPSWAFTRTICGDTIAKPSSVESSAVIHTRITSLADCRAVSNEIARELRSNPLEDNQSFKKPRIEFENNDGIPSDTLSVIQASVSGRSLFVSKKLEALGLCPKATAVRLASRGHNNEIFVLTGGRMPFVLRPVGSRHIPGRGMRLCHRILGSCYFHGFMDGEGIKEQRLQEIYLV
jgi:hypothetical protein